MATWAEIPRSPGHAFYDRLQSVLLEAGFDAFVEQVCKPYYAPRMGAPSLPPGRYFRMHIIGYFEGLDSERGIAWRCADSYSLREFLRLSNVEKVPDHSWLSRTRSLEQVKAEIPLVDEATHDYVEVDLSHSRLLSTYNPDFLIELVRKTGWTVVATYLKSPMQQAAFVCRKPMLQGA